MSSHFLVNLSESFKAISANWLRTTLTALIVAIGITSLVGIFKPSILCQIHQCFDGLAGQRFPDHSPQV